MGSDPSRIDQQVQDARREGAPANATYRVSDGTWRTTDEIWVASTRAHLGLDPLPPDTALITDILADAALTSLRLRDRYGLREIERPSPTHVRLWFTTESDTDTVGVHVTDIHVTTAPRTSTPSDPA